MKIALIDPSLFTWPYDNMLAKGLLENGHQVIIYGEYLTNNSQLKNVLYYKEVFYKFLKCDYFYRLPKIVIPIFKGLTHPYFALKLFIKLKKFQPDIIHFQWTPFPIIDQFLVSALKHIAPVILTAHDSIPFNGNPSSFLQKFASIKIMKKFDRMIVHTNCGIRRLTDYGIHVDQITRVPIGMMNLTDKLFIAKNSENKKLPFTILLFGHIKQYKGIDILINALNFITPTVLSLCNVHIVGQPHIDIQPLQKLANRLGVEKYITWDLRFIDDNEIIPLFTKASVVVLPYREIDASAVFMLALAAGKPIVASHIGQFAEMLTNGKHGYLVPVEDPKSLALAIEALVKSNQLCMEMGKNVQLLANSVPNWKEISQATLDVYYRAKRSRSKLHKIH